MTPYFPRAAAYPFRDINLCMWRTSNFTYHEGPVKVVGYDTETANGKAILITNSCGDYCYPTSFVQCLDFLTEQNSDDYRFFWNIGYDATAMAKWLDPKSLKELEDTESLKVGPYTVMMTTKFFSIKRKKVRWVFTDLMTVFNSGLDNAASKYLGKKKLEYDVIGMSESDILNNSELKKYCIHDSELTAELGQMFLEISNNLGKLPPVIYSPASISESLLYENNIAQEWQERMKNLPRAMIEAAYNSYCGGWVQVYQRGYFPKVRTYDINSAYPTQMLHLPVLSTSDIYHQKTSPVKNALGWLLVTVTVPETDLPRLRVQVKNGGYYPTGTYTIWATTGELAGLTYVVHDGWWIAPSEENEKLADLIRLLYKQKKSNKTVDDFKYLYYKLALNAMYGKTIQVTQQKRQLPKIGRAFNPFYASLITAGARMQVYNEARKEYPEKLVSISTDSFWTTRKQADPSIPIGSELGDWENEGTGPAVLLSSGVYEIRGEVNKSRSRSISNGNQVKPWFDILKKAITIIHHTKWGDNYSIKNEERRRVTLHAALYHKTHPLTDLNRILAAPRYIDLNSDVARWWGDEFVSTADLLSRSLKSLSRGVTSLLPVGKTPVYHPEYQRTTEDCLYEEMLQRKLYCRPGMDSYVEYREGVPLSKRKILTTNNSTCMTLDEYADRYDATTSEIIQMLAEVPYISDREGYAREQLELEFGTG